MRILCVIDSLCAGGAQRQLVELALGFKERGNEVIFLTYHDIPFFNPCLEKAGILIFYIEESNYLKRIYKIRKYIRNGMFDCVLSFLEAPNFICEFSGLPSRKWKLVVGERSANPYISKSVKLILYRWFHFLADFIVANSYANMEYIRKVNPFLSKSKCKVIYNVIDYKYWRPKNNFIFKKNGKLKLLITARHNYKKNLKGLVGALELMNPGELDKISIDWYGDSLTEPYFDNSLIECIEKIKEVKLGDVISFFPSEYDYLKIVQEADAIGLFSFYEGLPNVVCEGMACGKPIICSAVSDLPLLFSHNANLLFNPLDLEAIRRALTFLINFNSHELTQIGNLNLKIAKEKFDREAIITDYLKLLSK